MTEQTLSWNICVGRE